VANLQRGIKADRPLREIPTIQRRSLTPTLAQIALDHRDEAIFHAYARQAKRNDPVDRSRGY
jgi:hypothetical protein